MKPLTLLGVVLVVVGLAALAYQGFTYTTRDTVLDVGPITATADRQHRVAVPPWLGAVAVAGGIGLIVMGTRKS